MDNAKMIEGRFLKLQKGKRLIAVIYKALDEGKTVQLCTYTRVTEFKAKHREMIKMGATGAIYVQRGKNWDNTMGVTWKVAA